MSTKLAQTSHLTDIPQAPASEKKYLVISTDWNSEITDKLRDGAVETLLAAGVPGSHIVTERVPGAIELTYAAALAEQRGEYEAVIMLGCVIRGDTPHFDYVCQSVTQGMTQLNLRATLPVTFGVITVENKEQALDRAGGSLGNKGSEAAIAAIKMVMLSSRI